MKSDIIHSVNKVPVILFIIIIGAIFQSQAFGQELSASQKEIWKLEEKLWDTWKKEGGDSLNAFYHKEAIIWESTTAFPHTFSGNGYYHEAGDKPIESFKLTLYEIKNFGNVSVVQYDAEGVNFIKKHFRFRISNSWMKQDGKWVIIGATHGSCLNLPLCPE